MNILFRKKILNTISNHYELEKFIKENNFFSFFKKIPESYIEKINFSISNTYSLNYKSFKPWYRSIINYPETIYDENFLLSMGWEINDVKDFIVKKQKKNSKKLSENKKKYPEKYYDKTPKRIEYWIKKGYSEDEAKKIISNSQKTFSKEICVKKFGKEDGINVFNERQKKWIKTLYENNNLEEINKKRNAFDYSKKSIESLIDRVSFLSDTKKTISFCIKENKIENFIECVVEKTDIKNMSDIVPIISSKLVQNHYQTTNKIIKELFYVKSPNILNNNLYGHPVYHNGYRFKSIKEYKIAILLENKSIEYVYEKQYPGSQFKCDFFLPKNEIYIEYYGMLDGKKIENLDERQKKYFNKMNEKNLFCQEKNLNLVYDTNFNNLYKKITKII
jgi:hypothetical protein